MKPLGQWLIASVVTLAAASPAPAQAPAGQRTYVVTYIEVTPSAVGAAQAALKQAAASSRKESGSLRYETLEEVARPDHFAILEVWRDARAFADHNGGAAMHDLREALKPVQTGPLDQRTCLDLASGPLDTAANPDALYVVSHVDVTGNNKDPAIGKLQKLAADGRQEGALRFEPWEQTNRLNHFTVNEVWKDRAAYDAHMFAQPAREFREWLGPVTGALYDDRMYRIIQ
jgi:quinol monooxygenase YgiN